MYNFFNNQTKYRSFKKALKEVEKEGFFEDLVAEEDSVPVAQDMSKSLANLSGKRARESKMANDETIKTAELESSLDKQRAVRGEERDRLSRYQSSSKSDDLDYYKSLFRDSPTFLDDQETQSDPEFLDKETSSDELNSKIDEYNELAQRIKERRAMIEQREKELEQSQQEATVEPEIDMPVFAEEENQPEQMPQVKVEVVADIPEPEVKTITKTVVIEKEIAAQPKPKKKTTTTTRKRKRKYDADISGGFNY